MEQRALSLLAVILRTGQGQIGKTAEIGISRVQQVVEPRGCRHIPALGFLGISQLGHPAVVAELNRGHGYGLQLMNRLELGVTVPGLGQQFLNPGHVTGGQVGVSLNTNVSFGRSQLQASDLRGVTLAVVHLLHPMTQMQLASTLLDVVEDRTREPAMG